MAKTTNYGMYVTNAIDDPSFKSWRNNLAASTDGNMVKIDEALSELRDAGIRLEENGVGAVVWDKESASILVYTITGELVQSIPFISERDPSIEITQFDNSIGFAENGSLVIMATFFMDFNQTPVLLTFDGEEIDIEASYTLNDANIFSDTAFTLQATDKYGNVSEATSYIRFVNRVYYGTAEIPDEFNSSFIRSLQNSLLTDTCERTISVSAEDDEYVWYCLPADLGECEFSVRGFIGGFELVDTIEFTNSYGYTTDYHIYRSDNSGLENLTVEVS